MKDVAATLKRIDDEIVQRRQNIAYHQVEIARLEDTRRVLMGLAEEDIERAEQARNPERIAAQPVVQSITVRKIGGGEEEGPPPKTNGHGAHLNKSGDMRGMTNPRSKAKQARLASDAPFKRRVQADIPQEERQEYVRGRVLAALRTNGKPMDTADIRRALGMDTEWHKSRKVKALYNAISYLRRDGQVTFNPEDFTLSLPS